MSLLNLTGLVPSASKSVKPFFEDILDRFAERIHSIHVTGTAITEDFDEHSSDVNSIIVLKEMDLKFLELLAPLGRKYGKHRVAAPLIMTPSYIESSLDVFPVEFFNFRLLHATVFGEDIMSGLSIDKADLRKQCERELKMKLIWLRQGYLSSRGERKLLTDGLVSSISGYIPLFRSIIFLLGQEPPAKHHEVLASLSENAKTRTDVFASILREKREKVRLSVEELNNLFEDYYQATEDLARIVDEIPG